MLTKLPHRPMENPTGLVKMPFVNNMHYYVRKLN